MQKKILIHSYFVPICPSLSPAFIFIILTLSIASACFSRSLFSNAPNPVGFYYTIFFYEKIREYLVLDKNWRAGEWRRGECQTVCWTHTYIKRKCENVHSNRSSCINKARRVQTHFLELSFDYEKNPNTYRVMAAMKELWLMAQCVAPSQSVVVRLTMILFGMPAKVNACFCHHEKMKPATNYAWLNVLKCKWVKPGLYFSIMVTAWLCSWRRALLRTPLQLPDVHLQKILSTHRMASRTVIGSLRTLFRVQSLF